MTWATPSVWESADAPVLDRLYLTADMLELADPNGTDWAVDATGGVGVDSNNAGMTSLPLDDTTDEGGGWKMAIPLGATRLRIKVEGHAATAPGGASKAYLDLYARALNAGAAPGSWSSAVDLNEVDIGTDENLYVSETTVTLASLGLSANSRAQLQLTRDAGGASNLTGDFELTSVTVEVL